MGDHLGSTSLTANTSGALVGSLRYDAWGGLRYTSGTTPTPYRFTGQREEGSIQLYWYGSRWYDSALGRFAQADTIVPDPYHPLDWDRYSYARNNPIRYTDPTGHYVASADEGEGTCQDSLDCVYPEGHEQAGELIISPSKKERKQGAQILGTGLALLPGLETGDDVLTLLTGCGYTCQLGGEESVGFGGRAWAAIGIFAPVSGNVLRTLTGQAHHVLSRQIMKALNSHSTLGGVFDRESFIIQAADKAAHNGYQTWHRYVDEEVLEWINQNPGATPNDFLTFMRSIYNRPGMRQRFPDATEIFDMALEELQ